MNIKYLGHAAFLINYDNLSILIDPFISGNPICPININDLTSIDYILVTHGHSDHLGDTIEISKKFNSKVICNYEIHLYLSKYNINTLPMHIGGKILTDFGIVKMTPALHGSSIEEDNNIIYAGNPCGFLICNENITIYHAGDTGLTMDMKLLEFENIDIAMLPIGGTFTMDIKDASVACKFIKPKKVIPIHYDTFDFIKQDPIKLSDHLDDCLVEILKPGESLRI